jgi:hypothetical protein
MVKRLISSLVIAAMLVVPFSMNAQTSHPTFEIKKTVICGNALQELKELMDEFGEKIIFASQPDDHQIALFYHKNRKTWSVMEIVKLKDDNGKEQEYACLLASGYGGELRLKAISDWNM